MSNKYLLKLATIIDMGPNGEIHRVHSDPEFEERARNAKLVNKAGRNKYLKGALIGGAAVKAGLTVYAGKKLYDKYREKRALFDFLSPDRKKEVAQTGVTAAAGTAAGMGASRVAKRFKLGTPAETALMGGAGLLADYAAVKINKGIEHARNKQIP